MSGTGNDFIIIDNRSGAVPPREMVRLATRACRRGLSVGADGLVYIVEDEELDFGWRFFNSDGSEAEMCGNAARCVARLARMDGIAGSSMVFRTIAGAISATVEGSNVKVQLTRPTGFEANFPLVLGDEETIQVSFVDTGVPHTVRILEGQNLDEVDVAGKGRQIRFHPRFAPAGTNANFLRIVGPREIQLRTYERGVEAETLACGTGAVAAALVTTILGHTTSPVSVRTRGGDVLTIHLDQNDPMSGEVYLQGPAALVYRGQLTDETIQGG